MIKHAFEMACLLPFTLVPQSNTAEIRDWRLYCDPQWVQRTSATGLFSLVLVSVCVLMGN